MDGNEIKSTAFVSTWRRYFPYNSRDERQSILENISRLLIPQQTAKFEEIDRKGLRGLGIKRTKRDCSCDYVNFTTHTYDFMLDPMTCHFHDLVPLNKELFEDSRLCCLVYSGSLHIEHRITEKFARERL